MMNLWQYGPRLNEKAQKIVLDKFDRCLRRFCRIENIKLNFFDEIESLNHSMNKFDENHLAVGVYSYRTDDKDKVIVDEIYPRIKLTKDYNIYTLAHEIGHHLAIKNFKDGTEYIADHFILILAEEYLTDIERYIISISLKVFSKTDFPLPKIKREDWKKFIKEHNL
jgi:hypothetical protein